MKNKFPKNKNFSRFIFCTCFLSLVSCKEGQGIEVSIPNETPHASHSQPLRSKSGTFPLASKLKSWFSRSKKDAPKAVEGMTEDINDTTTKVSTVPTILKPSKSDSNLLSHNSDHNLPTSYPLPSSVQRSTIKKSHYDSPRQKREINRIILSILVDKKVKKERKAKQKAASLITESDDNFITIPSNFMSEPWSGKSLFKRLRDEFFNEDLNCEGLQDEGKFYLYSKLIDEENWFRKAVDKMSSLTGKEIRCEQKKERFEWTPLMIEKIVSYTAQILNKERKNRKTLDGIENWTEAVYEKSRDYATYKKGKINFFDYMHSISLLFLDKFMKDEEEKKKSLIQKPPSLKKVPEKGKVSRRNIPQTQIAALFGLPQAPYEFFYFPKPTKGLATKGICKKLPSRERAFSLGQPLFLRREMAQHAGRSVLLLENIPPIPKLSKNEGYSVFLPDMLETFFHLQAMPLFPSDIMIEEIFEQESGPSLPLVSWDPMLEDEEVEEETSWPMISLGKNVFSPQAQQLSFFAYIALSVLKKISMMGSSNNFMMKAFFNNHEKLSNPSTVVIEEIFDEETIEETVGGLSEDDDDDLFVEKSDVESSETTLSPAKLPEEDFSEDLAMLFHEKKAPAELAETLPIEEEAIKMDIVLDEDTLDEPPALDSAIPFEERHEEEAMTPIMLAPEEDFEPLVHELELDEEDLIREEFRPAEAVEAEGIGGEEHEMTTGADSTFHDFHIKERESSIEGWFCESRREIVASINSQTSSVSIKTSGFVNLLSEEMAPKKPKRKKGQAYLNPFFTKEIIPFAQTMHTEIKALKSKHFKYDPDLIPVRVNRVRMQYEKIKVSFQPFELGRFFNNPLNPRPLASQWDKPNISPQALPKKPKKPNKYVKKMIKKMIQDNHSENMKETLRCGG